MESLEFFLIFGIDFGHPLKFLGQFMGRTMQIQGFLRKNGANPRIFGKNGGNSGIFWKTKAQNPRKIPFPLFPWNFSGIPKIIPRISLCRIRDSKFPWNSRPWNSQSFKIFLENPRFPMIHLSPPEIPGKFQFFRIFSGIFQAFWGFFGGKKKKKSGIPNGNKSLDFRNFWEFFGLKKLRKNPNFRDGIPRIFVEL